MSEQKNSLSEEKHLRPELEEQIQMRHGDIYINLFEKGKTRELVVDPESPDGEKIEMPDAYAKLHAFQDFYYIKYMWVKDELRELGIGREVLHPKIKKFLDTQSEPKKPCLRYSERSQKAGTTGVAQRLGWETLSLEPWFIYIPEGVARPSDKRILDMIVTAAPEYAEYLPPGLSRGATLIDTIVGTALMLLVFAGITAAFQLSVDVVTNNKARAGAIALANERMEYVRSLSYSSVGTVGGIPSGTMPQSESVSLNGIAYTRRTIVLYEDDPKDGTGAADTNSITADDKLVKTEVSWTARVNSGLRKISLVTRVSPVNVEQVVPGGTLHFSILNSASQPLQDAQVAVVNAGVSPSVNLTTFSDAAGTVDIIGAPSGSGYQITVTKSGYSTAQTYSVTAQNTNPTPGHLTVSNNQTTSSTFAIDLLSTKQVWMRLKSNNTDISNVQFTMRGNKTIGSGPGGTQYKYSQTLGGALATTTISNLEWDTYTIALVGSTYDIASSCNPQPEALAANSSAMTTLYLAAHTTNSLLVDVKSSAGVYLSGASVRLYRVVGPAYDNTITTDSCGQSFFASLNSGSPGSGDAYTVEASANGYQTSASTNVTVSGTSRLTMVLN